MVKYSKTKGVLKGICGILTLDPWGQTWHKVLGADDCRQVIQQLIIVASLILSYPVLTYTNLGQNQSIFAVLALVLLEILFFRFINKRAK